MKRNSTFCIQFVKSTSNAESAPSTAPCTSPFSPSPPAPPPPTPPPLSLRFRFGAVGLEIHFDFLSIVVASALLSLVVVPRNAFGRRERSTANRATVGRSVDGRPSAATSAAKRRFRHNNYVALDRRRRPDGRR